MKIFLCFFMLSNIFLECFAVDYYSQGGVCPNILTNWDRNPGGDGGVPVSFTNAGDRFIIQAGDTMTTTTTWTIGGAGSTLHIQNGGILKGDHLIILTGVFQIDNGGAYIHSNTGSVAETAGSSIFSGAESFAADSHFEIRNWAGKNVGLPNASPGILWGDLIINLQADLAADALPWNWNLSDGSTLTIKGNLDIRSTYISTGFHTELCFTSSGIQTINVSGNFLLSGDKTKASMKGSYSNGYTTMQVDSNILFKDMSQFNLGLKTTDTNPYGVYELRFKGNFSAIDFAIMVYDSSNPAYLVANGTSPQTFTCTWNFNRNFRIAAGATVNLASPLNTTVLGITLAISGTLNQNGNNITTYGKIECAGGIFNSSGNLRLAGSCTACSNLNETYNDNDKTWCSASGEKGRINFINSNVILDNNYFANLVTAGSFFTDSPGDIYFINSSAASLYAGMHIGSYQVHKNSVFSLDENSYVGGGGAMYQGEGGTLRIGSVNGITAAGNTTTGNIRTGLSKDYDFSGTNSFEYFGTNPQVTGNGLPTTIDGTLKINNSAGFGTAGVTLSQSTTIRGILDLNSGKLTTSLANLVILDSSGLVNLPVWGASYVVGPMKKTGSTSFTFPIGKGTNFAPLTITGTGVATDEYIAEYFMANPAAVIGSAFDNPPIDHMSALEWWTVDRRAGATAKKVTLEATTYSDETLLSDLRNLRWDGAAWRNEGNTAYSGVSAGPVTSNIVNDFFAGGTATPFTFGSITAVVNPLLIQLISFDAIKLTSTKALLNWELAVCCSDAARFEIEKANGNNSNFTKIVVVNGNVTSRFYNYTDYDLKTGINYYRLKMIDEDGKITYSRTIAIMNGINGLLLTSLIPTMITNTAIVTVASSRQQKMNLMITDMQGKVMQKQNHTVSAGNTNIQLSTDRFAAGIYHLFAVTAEGKTNIISFTKQ